MWRPSLNALVKIVVLMLESFTQKVLEKRLTDTC